MSLQLRGSRFSERSNSGTTIAQLPAPDSADALAYPIRVVTDAITPDGIVPHPCYTDGAKWRLSGTQIEVIAATAPDAVRNYLRSWSEDCGASIVNRFGYYRSPATMSTPSSQNGGSEFASFDAFGPRLTYQTSTASNGGIRRSSGTPINVNPASTPNAFAYLRARVSFTTLSDAANEYNFRMAWGATGYALAANEIGIAYDRGNVLGGLNAGNSANWIIFSRSASTNTVVVSSVTPNTTAPGDELELLVSTTPSMLVEAWINGVKQTSITTNIPTAGYGEGSVLNKSAGTLNRNAVLYAMGSAVIRTT